jgi:hypothetical protein
MQQDLWSEVFAVHLRQRVDSIIERLWGISCYDQGGQDDESEANLKDGEGSWMSVVSMGPLPLKGGVCVIPTSKAVPRERARDEGDQGAASSLDIGVKATWAAHKGAPSR